MRALVCVSIFRFLSFSPLFLSFAIYIYTRVYIYIESHIYIYIYIHTHTYTISKRNKFPFYTVTYRLFKRKLKAENGIIIVVGHEGNLSVFSRKNRFLPPSLLLSIPRILSTIVFKVRGDLRSRFSPSSSSSSSSSSL